MTYRTHYRVYCPRCGHQFNVRGDDHAVENLLDQPCQQCYRKGQDAYIAGRDSPVKA